MTLIEGLIYSRLTTDGNVTAINGTKVYPVAAPQNVSAPYIVFTRTGTERDYTSNANDGLPTAIFEVNCWASSYSGLAALADVVRQSLDGYRYTDGTFTLRGMFIESEADGIDPETFSTEQPEYGRQFVVRAIHTETVQDYT